MSLDMRRLPVACCLVLAAAAPIVTQREAWTRPFPDFGGCVSFKPVSVDKIIADGDQIDEDRFPTLALRRTNRAIFTKLQYLFRY